MTAPVDILHTRWADILDATLQMVIDNPERRRLIAESLAKDVGVVRDRYVEQLEAGRETWKAKAEEMEADRDRLAAQVAAARTEVLLGLRQSLLTALMGEPDPKASDAWKSGYRAGVGVAFERTTALGQDDGAGAAS
ncbi:hypothetical protein QMK19_03475 [Streptomyces sp. H10-C2]|uniref:hypothetical protein n=1 Tax=unclassified Streptomyces TaxID=2593676 RepID=UPI0024B9D562|nr:MULTISPECIES: hypothetical protein [unclassified Streptomyces]MDJ0342247.1 hypothetical protein [Streptomyces sp. PH10-H1]MDJ0368761.1 hypothetical protein [Streptomyces sp. H10-C2]